MLTYVFARGATIQVLLDVIEGNPAAIASIEARLRKLKPGKVTLDAAAPIAAVFDVSSRAASPDVPAGWTLTIDEATSISLAAGSYLADAKIVVAGGTITTDPVRVQITEPATA